MNKKNKIFKIFLNLILSFSIIGSTILYLAVSKITNEEEGKFSATAKFFSKSLIMSNYDVYKNLTVEDYASNILDEDYEFEDLEHPYYEKIRNDKRLKQFYNKHSYSHSDYVEMMDYLRDLFPHGAPSKSYLNINLIEMINAAENGERFMCGKISKMLSQMIMASGTYARFIKISNKNGGGHTALEYWNMNLKKWIVLDPAFNLYYSSIDGVKLNAIEIFYLSNAKSPIHKHLGASDNSIFTSETKLYEAYYKYGVALDYHHHWVSKNYKRKNPIRSPINSCVYLGLQRDRKMYFKYDFHPNNKAMADFLYQDPFGRNRNEPFVSKIENERKDIISTH